MNNAHGTKLHEVKFTWLIGQFSVPHLNCTAVFVILRSNKSFY